MPSVGWRNASRFILGFMLFGSCFLALPHVLLIATAWSAWSNQPARFWRPFTIISILAAGSAAFCWVKFTGTDFIFVAEPKPSNVSSYANALAATIHQGGDTVSLPADPAAATLIFLYYWITSYIVGAMILLPHSFARVAYSLKKIKLHDESEEKN